MSDVKFNGLNLVSSNSAPVSSAAEPRQSTSVGPLTPQAQSGKIESKGSVTAEATQPQNGSRELNDAVAQLNDYVQSIQRDLSFEIDEASGKTVITVLDRKTQEVVRQIPDEVALRLARNLQQDEPL